MELEPWWGLAGSPKFPCSLHIPPVVVQAPGTYLAAALLLPCLSNPRAPLGCNNWLHPSARWMSPPSLLKRFSLEWWLLHSRPACPLVHPEGEIREEETTRGPSRSLGKSHPIWLVWQLLSLAPIWIVNPLLRVEVGKQALKTSALVGGVWCLMNHSAKRAEHKAFQKERRFQYGSLRPLCFPGEKLAEWSSQMWKTDTCSLLH